MCFHAKIRALLGNKEKQICGRNILTNIKKSHWLKALKNRDVRLKRNVNTKYTFVKL